jgi:sugar phosphate isomerase/epimerase
MDAISRRWFIGSGLAACTRYSWANPLGLPIGLQLYSVAAELQADFAGTLKQVAAIGYTQVEFAGFGSRSAAEIRQAIDAAGLKGIGAHYSVSDLEPDAAKAIAYAHDLGLHYMICSFPKIADPAGPPAITLDDWKWNADFFNRIGEATRKASIRFGYHNHNVDFRRFGSETGLDALIRMTDPTLVTLEMDCGWVAAAGEDPVHYLTAYPDRFRLLHVKDVRPGFPPNTNMKIETAELGRGVLDWKRIFAAAKQAGVTRYYVELEPPHRRAALDEVRANYDFLRRLS